MDHRMYSQTEAKGCKSLWERSEGGENKWRS